MKDKEFVFFIKEKLKVVKFEFRYVENDLWLMVNSKGGIYKIMKFEGVILCLVDYL